MREFYTLLTNTGKAQLTNAQATRQALNLTKLAVGDGNGAYVAPNEQQTALVREVWRAAINHIYVDSNNTSWLVIEAVIPDTVGGWTVREVGVFDDADNFIAVGAYPETYEPQLSEGSGRDLYIRMILEVSNAAQVELKIDPAIVLTTRDYVERTLSTPLHVLAASLAQIQLEQLRQADRIKDMTGAF